MCTTSTSGRRGLFSILDWLPPPLDLVCWHYLFRILRELDVPHLRSAGMDWISLYCGLIPPHTHRTRYLRNFFLLNLSPPTSLLNNSLRNKSKALYDFLALPIQQSSPTENYISSCRPWQWLRQHLHATGHWRQGNAGLMLHGGKGQEDG